VTRDVPFKAFEANFTCCKKGKYINRSFISVNIYVLCILLYRQGAGKNIQPVCSSKVPNAGAMWNVELGIIN
jgi:hypothetical protein